MFGIRTRYPEPPVNVRLTYADGSELPVSCTYEGWDRVERSHVWLAINPRPDEVPGGLLADKLPAQTTIAVEGRLE
jgi:hypothetical protein